MTSASLCRLCGILAEIQNGSRLGGDFLTGFDKGGVGEIFFRRARREAHTHFRTADHEGIAHVVSRVAHVDEADSVEMSETLADGQKIRQKSASDEIRW